MSPLGVSHGGIGWTISESRTHRVVFHGFESLPHERNDLVFSEPFVMHGYKWRLELFPGGDYKTNTAAAHVSLYLDCMDATNGEAKVTATFKLRIPSADHSFGSQSIAFGRASAAEGKSSRWGFPNYVQRDFLLDPSTNFLVDGDLIIHVKMQVMLDTTPMWKPSDTTFKDNGMLKLLESAKYADVVFLVGQDERTEKLYAHSLILHTRAPKLAELVENCGEAAGESAELVESCAEAAGESEAETLVPFHDFDPNVFRQVLRFVYGGEIPDQIGLSDNAKSMIDLANKAGVTQLKLVAEWELAQSGITVDNAANLILFAHDKNCALLKEAAVDFFRHNAEAVKESDGYAEIAESAKMLAELVDALVLGDECTPPGYENSLYGGIRVRVLRQKLQEKGLDVDGSKEMLIQRLERADRGEIDSENEND